MKSIRIHHGTTLAMSILVICCVGCGMFEMDSRWRDRDVVIDGIDESDEWDGARYFYDEKQVTVGILNDNDALYLRLSSRDQLIQRKILMGGLTVWLDGDGAQNETLGFHFPQGPRSRFGAMRPGGEGTEGMDGEPGTRDGAPGGFGGPFGGTMENDGNMTFDAVESMMKHMVTSLSDELEIIGPDEDARVRVGKNSAFEHGIEYAIDYSGGNLVYELRVPLHRTDACRYGISAHDEVTVVGIGCESGEMQQMRSGGRSGGPRDGGGLRPSGGGIGGAMTGGGGGMSGGGGRGGRGPGGGMPQAEQQPLELWMKTFLALPE